MKYRIPAKTFFLGEYAALAGGPAMLLTTTPCFEITVTQEPGLIAIHPNSPAGRLWAQQGLPGKGLHWHDPYGGIGGLGASSAQFLGAYLAINSNKNGSSHQNLLDIYFNVIQQGPGTRPSGYDVLAQSSSKCVYIYPLATQVRSYAWPFTDLAFILVHTGKKLATHHHLQQLAQITEITSLIALVESAHQAFQSADSTRMIEAVNAYHACLLQMNLVALHSLELINQLRSNSNVLAVKGCGAMGADVLLLLLPANELENECLKLTKDNWSILGTSLNLHLI